jgi:hypothetical protein
MSQFGVVWLVIAAPLIVVARDVFRYVCGRLGSPPRPSGVLPDQPWPSRVPLMYWRREIDRAKASPASRCLPMLILTQS